jgi:hypothetical protein
MTKVKIANPLDELFQTETETPVVEYGSATEGELAQFQANVPSPEIDPEDQAIDAKIDTIYEAALDAFNTQTQYTQIIEPRYAARNAEVAANYLNIALNAVATRARVKTDRKRANTFVPYAQKTQNNVVVASREDIMKMISIDAEMKDDK